MTPRPPLQIGTWGRVARQQLGPSRWRAFARYRDIDGVTRQVEANGRTGAAAERLLMVMLADRQMPVKSEVSRSTKLAELSQLWFTEIEATGRAGRRTIDGYKDTYRRHIEAPLGQLRISEVTTGRLDRFLKNLAADHATSARHAKIVLTGILGIAVRYDVLRTNPVRDVAPIKLPEKQVRALTAAQARELRRKIIEWQYDTDHEGRPRATDLVDVLDIFLGTGARIGEVLAIRWQDVNLEVSPATITISGTVIMEKGRGTYRQDSPKTKAGFRMVKLPGFAAATLRKMQETANPSPEDMVFPSSTGTVRSPHNFRRQWRDARAGTTFEWVTPHVFRKTVATLVDREFTSKQASAQLGHSSTAITEKHYIERAIESPDVTRALDALGEDQRT